MNSREISVDRPISRTLETVLARIRSFSKEGINEKDEILKLVQDDKNKNEIAALRFTALAMTDLRNGFPIKAFGNDRNSDISLAELISFSAR